MRFLRENSKEHRLALKAEKRYLSERTRVLRLYAVHVQEVKYGQRGRGSKVITAGEMVEEAMAWVVIPQPPPEIGRWTRSEAEILMQEVLERQRRGLGLLAPWEIEPMPVTGEDGGDDWIEFAEFTAPADALLLAA